MADCVHVTVRLEVGCGVPSGVIVVAGTSTPFRGWLELLRRVEEARSGLASCPGTDAGGE